MKHAAPKASATGRAGKHAHNPQSNAQLSEASTSAYTRRRERGAHTHRHVQRTVEAASSSSVALVDNISQAVLEEINYTPRTRREKRQAALKQARKSKFASSGAIALLLSTVSGLAYASMNSDLFTRSIQVAAAADSGSNSSSFAHIDEVNSASSVSRSDLRTELVASVSSSVHPWNVETSSNTLDMSALTQINHPTGDVGLTYEWSQCTWWVYIRRHQLNLPVGSYFGNGWQWANSARKLGYQVDRKPQVGDIMVFAPGQAGSSSVYGHVAIVEAVNPDGSVTTSECGASFQGKIFSRTISDVSNYEFIHS